MPRPQTQLDALSPGQLAKRWGLAVDRVRQLIESGKIVAETMQAAMIRKSGGVAP
jgi:hypothetical protein